MAFLPPVVKAARVEEWLSQVGALLLGDNPQSCSIPQTTHDMPLAALEGACLPLASKLAPLLCEAGREPQVTPTLLLPRFRLWFSSP